MTGISRNIVINKSLIKVYLDPRFCLLFFIFFSGLFAATSSGAKEGSFFVKAPSGLNLRESPSIKSKNIALIPDNSKVDVLEIASKEEKIGDMLAPWIKIRFKTNTGWVFGGFVYKKNLELKNPDGTLILREWTRGENCNYNYYQPPQCITEIYNSKSGKLERKDTLSGIIRWYDNRRLLLKEEIGDCGAMVLAHSVYDVITGKSEEIFNFSVTSACGMETVEGDIKEITTLALPQGNFFMDYNENKKITALYKISGKINEFFKREEKGQPNGFVLVRFVPDYSLLKEIRRWTDSSPPQLDHSCLPEPCLKINGKKINLGNLLK